MAVTKGSGANFIDRIGQRFGRWLVVERHPQKKKVRWVCQCDCGTLRDVAAADLVSGRTNSCGCLQKDGAGKTLTKLQKREYHSWSGMKQRCLYHWHIEWHRYGGRGITICDSWRNSFESFFRDMGPCPAGMSLDRINLDGPYAPDNCQWATKETQAENTSKSVHVEFNGERFTLKKLASHLGINYFRLHAYHRRRGLSLEEAIAKAKEPGINRPYRFRPESPRV